jgi:hypothetical protein
MDNGQTDPRNGSESAAQPSAPAKKGRKNGSASLLRAKHLLDDVLGQLGAFPELREEASTLREKILATLLETERAAGRQP